MISIVVGAFRFRARWEEENAPLTCSAFRRVLPFENSLIQARWSGEAGWIPMGDYDLGIGRENVTTHPSKGEVLFYPAGISETEILFVYGHAMFASTAGPLAGNHFLTITEGVDQLAALGEKVLWEGAQPIRIEAAG
ncbi:MAG: DUF3830 family protein [Proteobacteria bacterium]|nr:DUF3830 family protein [Pseudomonadota bacterium]MDA1059603.1 DUF3830 family protein [Pseudomonadota bacterium]